MCLVLPKEKDMRVPYPSSSHAFSSALMVAACCLMPVASCHTVTLAFSCRTLIHKRHTRSFCFVVRNTVSFDHHTRTSGRIAYHVCFLMLTHLLPRLRCAYKCHTVTVSLTVTPQSQSQSVHSHSQSLLSQAGACFAASLALSPATDCRSATGLQVLRLLLLLLLLQVQVLSREAFLSCNREERDQHQERRCRCACVSENSISLLTATPLL